MRSDGVAQPEIEQIAFQPRAWPILLLHILKEPAAVLAYLASGTMGFTIVFIVSLTVAIFVPLFSSLLSKIPRFHFSRIPLVLLAALIASWPAFSVLTARFLRQPFFLILLLAADILLVAATLGVSVISSGPVGKVRKLPSLGIALRFVWLIVFVMLRPTIEHRFSFVAWGATGVLGIIAIVFAAAEPFADLLCVRLCLKRGGSEVTAHYWTTSISVYTTDDSLVTDGVLITEATVSTRRRGTPLHGIAFDFSSDPYPRLERLRALNTAACELYERCIALENPARGRNVNSNGVALHTTLRQAKERSMQELIERDSTLAHFYTSRAPLAMYDLKLLQMVRDIPAEVAAVGSIAVRMESAHLFRLYSPLPGLGIYWLVLRHGGRAVSGWATGPLGDPRVVSKAFSEAISAYRFSNLAKNSDLIAKHRQDLLPRITHDNFLDVARELGITNTDLQCVILMSSDAAGENLEFLEQCSRIDTLEQFLRIEEQASWYPLPWIDYDVLAQPSKTPLVVVRTSSKEIFQIDWPYVEEAEIQEVATRKGIVTELGRNVQSPCIVY